MTRGAGRGFLVTGADQLHNAAPEPVSDRLGDLSRVTVWHHKRLDNVILSWPGNYDRWKLGHAKFVLQIATFIVPMDLL